MSTWKRPDHYETARLVLLEYMGELKDFTPKDAALWGFTNPAKFYTNLLGALAHFESNQNDATTYKEAFKDSKGQNVISRGLLQISIESANGYGAKLKTADQLHFSYTNLFCGVLIMRKWILKDGVISGGKPGAWRGMARYWSQFRKPNVLAEMRERVKKEMGGNQMKLAVVVGHSKRSPGAFSKYLQASEYQWNLDLAALMKGEGEKLGVDVLIETRDVGGITGAYQRALKKKPAAVIELHFNSATPAATGTETLYADQSDNVGIKEVALAKMVNDAMVMALDLRDRGIKRRVPGDRGYGNLAQTKDVPSILIEPFFGSNPNDCRAAREEKRNLAKAIVKAFADWAKT